MTLFQNKGSQISKLNLNYKTIVTEHARRNLSHAQLGRNLVSAVNLSHRQILAINYLHFPAHLAAAAMLSQLFMCKLHNTLL